jgi:hypothetical protein
MLHEIFFIFCTENQSLEDDLRPTENLLSKKLAHDVDHWMNLNLLASPIHPNQQLMVEELRQGIIIDIINIIIIIFITIIIIVVKQT